MRKVLFILIIMSVISTQAQVNWQNNPVGAVFAREGGETPEGVFRLVSGGTEVYTLISSAQTEFYQPASLFYGENDINKSTVDALAPDGKVASSMNCFLVRKSGRNLLFDTGLPTSRGGKIIERLNEIKIKAENIDAVYITHSHYDHIGGLLGDDDAANFPNATVYFPSVEYQYMKSSNPDFTEKLNKAYGKNVKLIEWGEIITPEMILPIAIPGHTPGHTAFRIDNLLFAGDILHGMSLQLIDPTICASFDADKTQAIESRNSLLDYAASASLTVLGAHVPNNGVLF